MIVNKKKTQQKKKNCCTTATLAPVATPAAQPTTPVAAPVEQQPAADADEVIPDHIETPRQAEPAVEAAPAPLVFTTPVQYCESQRRHVFL